MLGSVNGRSLPLIGYQDYCDATIWALATLNKLKVPSHPTSWVAVCVAAHCIRCEQTLSWSQQHDFHHYFVLFSTQHGTQTHTESIERVWARLQLKVIRRSLKLSCSEKLSCRPTTQIQIALEFRGAIEKVPLLLKESRYLLPKSSFWRSLTDIIIRKFLHERKSSLRCVTYQPSCFFSRRELEVYGIRTEMGIGQTTTEESMQESMGAVHYPSGGFNGSRVDCYWGLLASASSLSSRVLRIRRALMVFVSTHYPRPSAAADTDHIRVTLGHDAVNRL